MDPIGIRSRQRIGVVLLLLFIGLCPGVRPVGHKHSEYGRSAEAAAVLDWHVKSFHGLAANDPWDASEGFHFHWMFVCQDSTDPHCRIQSAAEGQVFEVLGNAVSDAVRGCDSLGMGVCFSVASASGAGRLGCDSCTASHSMRLVRSAHALYGVARI